MAIRLEDIQGLTPQQVAAQYSPADIKALMEQLEPPGFIDRAASGFATTPTGEVNILRDRGHDAYLDNGTPMVRTGAGTMPVDPEGFDMGDFADMVGRVPRTVLSVLGGIGTLPQPAGSAMLGAAGGGLVGAGIEQAIGNALGSKEGINEMDLATEPLYSLGGDVLGRGAGIVANKALAPFKGALSDRLNKTVVGAAGKFDKLLGTDIAGKLPISAQTEHRGLQQIEQQVAQMPVTMDRFEREVLNPYEREVVDAFDKLRGKLGSTPSRLTTGEAAFDARNVAIETHGRAVDEAYDELRALVAPNAPIVTPATNEAIDRIAERTGAVGPDFEMTAATREAIESWRRDVEKITDFGGLDNLRRSVGNKLKSRGMSEDIERAGLDAHVADLYGALAKDAENFFMQGARLTDDQMMEQGNRVAVNEALQQGAQSSARAEKISVSQAIDRLGGLNTRGISLGEMSEKVRRRVKGVETKYNRQGAKPVGVDLMAERLGQEFPELGIETSNDLLEVLRRDDRFFTKQIIDFEQDAVEQMAARQIDVDFRNLDQLEMQIESGDTERLIGLRDRLDEAVDRGDLSRVNADRLGSRIRQRLVDVAGDDRATVDAISGEAQERAAGLHREIPAKAKRATGLAREGFDLARSGSARRFRDPDQVEKLATDMLGSGYQVKQVQRMKQLMLADPTPMGVGATEEGTHAWGLVQSQILDEIAGTSRKAGREGITDALSGAKMLSKIERMGGLPKLKAIFGDEMGQRVFDFAAMIKHADAGERLQNTSNTGRFMSLYNDLKDAVRRPLFAAGSIASQGALGAAVITPGGRKYLTEGVLQDATSQNFIRTLGRAAGQVGAHTAQDSFGR